MVTKQGNYCTCNLHLLVTAFSDWHWLWLSSHQFCQHAIQLPCSFYMNFYGMWVHEHAYWGGWVQWLGLLLTVIDVSTTCVVLIFRDKVNNCELWIVNLVSRWYGTLKYWPHWSIKQAIWYYAMVRFCTIDLKLCPTAQFEENCIIHKKMLHSSKVKNEF